MTVENFTIAEPRIIDTSYNSIMVNPNCGAPDLFEAMTTRLEEINSLATVSTGEGFDNWNDDIKAYYLNLIARHTKEIEVLLLAYNEKLEEKENE